MNPLRIDVRTSAGQYTAIVGEGLASRLGRVLDERRLRGRRFIVSNPLVWKLHGPDIARALPGTEVFLVPDGERYKTLATVSRIYDHLVRAEADRGSILLTVGGGVIGDMAGFAAATYMRGLTLVHVPTTLLAQVDASIGGKVGVNLGAGKNLVGAFYPPAVVVTDPLLLATLPRREFRSGLYEVIKYGMACSAALFERLQRDVGGIFSNDPAVLVPLIAECCSVKAAIVSADEREAGPRRVLNFGHTAGHALEAVTRYRRFRHGEAVGYGMMIAADIAVERGLLPAANAAALRTLIMQLGPLPPVSDLPVPQVLEAIRRDKKVENQSLHFVLPAGIGATAIATDVSTRELGAAMKKLGFRPK